MRPATSHFVITMRECIAFGGHFYMNEQMKMILRGIIEEHYVGRDVTNTEHLKAPLLLMKAVCSIAYHYVQVPQQGMCFDIFWIGIVVEFSP